MHMHMHIHIHIHIHVYIYPDQPICHSRWDCDALEATLVVGASLDAVCSTGKQNQGHVIVLLCKNSQQISMFKNLNTCHISIHSNMFKYVQIIFAGRVMRRRLCKIICSNNICWTSHAKEVVQNRSKSQSIMKPKDAISI